MTIKHDQWIRKINTVLFNDTEALDLSELHLKFQTEGAQVENPNTLVLRVYNLSKNTLNRVINNGEFNKVAVSAGYQNGNFGLIFKGVIKQFRIGRENATDTYLDILAADGDFEYNQGVVNTTLQGANNTPAKTIEALSSAMGTTLDSSSVIYDNQHVPNIRGTVLFGMARARMRNVATTLDASWTISNGKMVVVANSGYLEGEAVKINIATGLIGMPEQTDGGIKIKCLLNSRIRIGGLVQLNNSEINQLLFQNPDAAPIPYDQWAGFQNLASLSPDGTYMVFSVTHEGDTRGTPWYSNLVCLAVKVSAPSTKKVDPR